MCAQLLDEQFSPLVDQRVMAAVYLGDQAVLKKRLAAIPDSGGLYRADLVEARGLSGRVGRFRRGGATRETVPSR